MPRIVGIDPSLRSVGWVVRSQGGYLSGIVSAPKLPVESYLNRYQKIVRGLCTRVQKGDMIILEDYAVYIPKRGQVPQSVIQLIELGGILRLSLRNRTSYHPILVPPAVLKKFATGKGRAQKDQVMLSVYKTWGLEFDTHDETDAWVLSQIGMSLFGLDDTHLNKARRECLETVKRNHIFSDELMTFLKEVSQ